MTRFLRHIVESAFRGESGQFKEAAIGHAVFDRPVDYDTKQDPVVRNEARRLRAKLEQYYQAEGSEEPWKIEVPRGGYAPVFVRSAPNRQGRTPVVAEPLKRYLAFCFVLLLMGGGMYWWVSRAPAVPTFGKVRPLSSTAESELHAVFDRKASRLAYASNAAGNYDIYLRELSGKVTRLTQHSADEIHPSFSPDGKELLFARASTGGFDIVLLNLGNGKERVVARSEGLMFGNPGADPTEMFGTPGPAWSPNGPDFAFTTTTTDNRFQRAIHICDVRTGKIRQLTNPSGQQHDLDPAYSPDGKYIAFGRWLTNSASELYLVEVSSGNVHKITEERADYRGIAWLPDGKAVVVSSNRSGLFGLWFLSLADGEMRPMALSSSHARDPAISPDGKHLVFAEYRQQSEIWRSSTRFHPQGIGLHEESVRSIRQNHSAQYSPDGSSIAYVSDRSGSWEIWLEDLLSRNSQQITKFEGPMLGSVQWSPKGNKLAFDARPAGSSAIFVAELSPKNIVRKWSQGAFEEKMPSWSIDGLGLFFNSNRGGRQQLWKAPLDDAAQATLVAPDFATDSRVASTGDLLYFTSQGGQWRVVPVAGGEGSVLGIPRDGKAGRVWSANEKGIWLVDTKPNPQQVLLFNRTTRSLSLAASLPGPIVENTPSLSISPDSKWVLYSIRRESKSQLLLLEAN